MEQRRRLPSRTAIFALGGLVLVLAALALLAAPASASTCTGSPTLISVDDSYLAPSNLLSCQFQSVPLALTVAQAGDTMYVYNGAYTFSSNNGFLNVTGLSIVGESQDGVVISANATGASYGIYVNAPSVTLFNFTLGGGGYALWTDAASARFANVSNITAAGASANGFVLYGPYGTERNLTVRSCGYGFALQGAGHFGDNLRATTTTVGNYKFYTANTDSAFSNVTLFGAASDNAMTISSPGNNISFTNFVIENATSGTYQSGLYVNAAGVYNFTNLTIRNAYQGIQTTTSATLNIKGLDIGVSTHAVNIAGGPASLTLTNALIHNVTSHGVLLEYPGATATLTNVSLENMGLYGARMFQGARLDWVGGRVNQSVYGYYQDSGFTWVNITGVTFSNASTYAMYNLQTTLMRIENCTFQDQATGLYLANIDGARLLNNTFRNHSNYALRTYISNSRVAGNVFTEDATPYVMDLVTADSPFNYYNMSPANTFDGKPLVFLLNQSNVTIPAGAGTLVLINVSNITADGFVQPRSQTGVWIFRGSGVRINNATINATSIGAQVFASADIGFSNITMVGRQTQRLFWAYGTSDFVVSDATASSATIPQYAVYLDSSANARISRVRVNQTQYGAYLTNAPSARIVGLDVAASSQSEVYASTANGLVLDGIQGTSTSTALSLNGAGGFILANSSVLSTASQAVYLNGLAVGFINNVTANATAAWPLYLATASNVTARNSTFISGNNWAAELEYSPDFHSFNSTYRPGGNSWSVVVNVNSYNAVLVHNNFYTYAPYDGYGYGTWDAGYPGAGNYHGWYGVMADQFTGPAQNSVAGKDGIKDAPALQMGGGSPKYDNYALIDPWPPTAALTSPLVPVIAAGTVVNFSVSNFFDAVTWVDSYDGSTGPLAYPHDLNTTGWGEGFHNITITATDGIAPTVVKTFVIEVDSSPPIISAVPAIGTAVIAQGALINVTVTEPHFNRSYYRVDGVLTNATQVFAIDTQNLSAGMHTVDLFASDVLNRTTTANWSLYIDDRAPTLTRVAPVGTDYFTPATVLTYAASDEYNLTGIAYIANGPTGSYGGGFVFNGANFDLDLAFLGEGCFDLLVEAIDAARHSTDDQWTMCLDGTAPDLNAYGDMTTEEGVPFTFDGSLVVDLDTDPFYTWAFDEDQLLTLTTLNGANPAYTFYTPGDYAVQLDVVDHAGNQATKVFTMHVSDVTAPVVDFTIPGVADEDTTVDFDATATTDNDGYWDGGATGAFDWEITSDAWSFSAAGMFTQVIVEEPGFYNITLRVTDRTGNQAELTKAMQVLDVTPPTIDVGGNLGPINVGDTVHLDASASIDNAPGPLDFVWTFTYNSALQTVNSPQLDFTFSAPGTYAITLTVSDVALNEQTTVVSVRVNSPPVITGTPISAVDAGAGYQWTAQVQDADAGDTHTFSLVQSPTGMSVSSAGVVTWQTQTDSYGVYTVVLRVSDGLAFDEVSYLLTVRRAANPANHPPAFTSFPVQSGLPGTSYTYTPTFSDVDGDHLSLVLSSGPAGMTVDANHAVHWTIPANGAGVTYDVSLMLSDGLATVYQNYTIRSRVNDAAPALTPGKVPPTVSLKPGDTYELAIDASVVADNDDALALLTASVVVSDPSVLQATLVPSGTGWTLTVTALKEGSATVALRIADPSGLAVDAPIAVTAANVVAPPPPGGGLPIMLIAGAGLAAALGLVAIVALKRRRKDVEPGAPSAPSSPAAPAAALAPPAPAAKPAAVEEVSVEVVQAPAARVEVPSIPPAAAPAVALGAAVAGAAAARPAPPPAIEATPKPSKATTYVIEGLFVIYQDGRMIYSKTDIGQQQLGDPELVSSMFTAVQQFIKDSFSAQGELNKMGYGENTIVIERGNNIFMAVITFGEPDKELQETMKDGIDKMEYGYAGIIEKWDGNANAFPNIFQYVGPVLALTANATRSDVLAATTTRDVKVISQLEFFQGFVRLKVGVKNDTEAVITKVTLDIDFNEDVLRLQRIEPATYKTSAARVMLNVLNPGEKSSVAFYFDPQICTETNIDGIVRYRDYRGALSSVTMKTRKAEVVCPLFFTKEHANTAMLKRLIETELQEKDSKVYSITKLPPYVKHKDIFDVTKSVVLSHDVHMVREFVSYNPFAGEAWFYGETKVKGYKIVIRTAVHEDNTIEFFAASTVIKAVTGLLAEFNHTLVSMILERYSDVKIDQIYDENKKHQVQARALIERLGEGEAGAGETDQRRGA